MKLLAVSTSTPRGSVALLDDAGPGAPSITESAYVDLQGHAERIFEAIDRALSEAGVDRRALDLLACDVGPGSFTGVRVGVATTKGIALGLDLPLIGVGSLEAMAAAAFALGAAGAGDPVVAAIDAKKGEVFLAAYDASLTALVPPRYLPAHADTFTSLGLDRSFVIVGEIAAALLPGVPRDPAFDLPDAAWVARVARSRAERGARDAADVEPLYVRPADAKPMVA